jgi:hypothetical protein
MKKIVLTLAALATLSTASFAERTRSYDLRDLETVNGHTSDGTNKPVMLDGSATTASAFAIPGTSGGVLTAYERALMNAYINEHGGR